MLHVEKRKGEINLNLDSSELISNGDDVHLTNVFSNLFDNAIKYNLKPPILSISSKITKEWIIVTVEDNGIGIRKENQKKVFDKFFRVPTGNVHDVKGFGLGFRAVWPGKVTANFVFAKPKSTHYQDDFLEAEGESRVYLDVTYQLR